MKNACWSLFGLSVVVFLIGSISKLTGNDILDIWPVAWWRAAMALVIYAMALKIIAGDK